MPTSPTRRVSRPTVMVDLPCASCGYNLRGSVAGRPCPECGASATDGDSGPPALPRYRTPMVDSDLAWLRRFRAGAALLIAGSLSMVLTAPALVVPMLFPAVVVAGALWWFGVLLVTAGRPAAAVPDGEPAGEWLALRTVSRFSQAAWMLVGGAGGALLVGGADPSLTAVAFGTSLAIGWMGLLALCVYLSNVAQWARDTGLANRLLSTVWVLGFVVGLGLLLVVVVLTGGRTAPGGASLFAGAVGIGGMVMLGICGVVVFLRALELHRLALWTVRARLDAEERLGRLRERASRGGAESDE